MATRLKEEKDINFIDYDLLKKETKRLQAEKRKLISEISAEGVKLSNLKEKGIELEKQAEKIISEAKEKAKSIIAKAKEKEDKSNALEAEVQSRIAEANKAKREADNLIKSNKGREAGLAKEKELIAETKSKLNKVLELIKDVI